MNRPPPVPGHAGEREARRRFSQGAPLDDDTLGRMIRRNLPPAWIAFIEAQPFFFTATSDAEGGCDAGYRGREHTLSGRALPLLKVQDDRHLLFPDFSGNGMFSSLGNLLVNPRIGLLFIDFTRLRRLRVNGGAEVIEEDETLRRLWPQARRGVRVTVCEAFANCPARIPRLHVADPDPWES